MARVRCLFNDWLGFDVLGLGVFGFGAGLNSLGAGVRCFRAGVRALGVGVQGFRGGILSFQTGVRGFGGLGFYALELGFELLVFGLKVFGWDSQF